jgi:predicted Zn-dependent protease
VKYGIEAWNEAALYGEVELAEAGSLQEADVVVEYGHVNPPIDLSNCSPSGGLAVTTFCLTDNGLHLKPFPLVNGTSTKVKFVVTVRVGLVTDALFVQRLVTHEMGHVLGIGQHSPDANDLMYFEALSRDKPSPADRATLTVLYHTVPDITP